MDKTSVRKNKYGRGVYAKRDFKRGEIVEIAPVVVMPKREVGVHARLSHYVFEWGPGCYAVALGYGSLFNHSSDPDVLFSLDKPKRKIIFRAVRPIRRGQEIMTSYGYDPTKFPMRGKVCT